jgi:hypothetical protein
MQIIAGMIRRTAQPARDRRRSLWRAALSEHGTRIGALRHIAQTILTQPRAAP